MVLDFVKGKEEFETFDWGGGGMQKEGVLLDGTNEDAMSIAQMGTLHMTGDVVMALSGNRVIQILTSIQIFVKKTSLS